jgi:hypothetical protein
MERNQNQANQAGQADRGTNDWASEERYWRDNFKSRPYARNNQNFDELAPAYRYGTESANRLRDRQWGDVETDLERGWDQARGTSKSTWQEAKSAVRDAWDRITNRGGASRSNNPTAR